MEKAVQPTFSSHASKTLAPSAIMAESRFPQQDSQNRTEQNRTAGQARSMLHDTSGQSPQCLMTDLG